MTKQLVQALFWLIAAVIPTCAQNKNTQFSKQTDSSDTKYARIIPMDRAALLKNVDVIFNMQYADNNDYQNGMYTGSNFAMNQFRLEIKGQVADHVFFRYRERFTREPVPQSIDNINHSIDMSFVEFDLSKKWSVAFGKMSSDYGGYEFLVNPIYIYQYNDIIGHADDFLTGAQATWNFAAEHSFTVQFLNARTATFAQLYDTIPGVSASKFPVSLVDNWEGSFAHGKISTFWSYTIINEAHHRYIYYTALGNQFHLGKWLIQYDFKYNPEGIDRIGVVTGIVPKTYSPYTALNTFYLEHWLHVEYNFVSQWKATVTGMTSAAWWYGNPDPDKNSHVRTDYGIIPTMEFYPYKKLNLKFYAAYVGRYYDYTSYSKAKFAAVNSTTGVIMLGFISPLNVL